MNARRLSILPVFALLLASCAQQSTMDPAEVLDRTAAANRNLSSAVFTVDADFRLESDTLQGISDGTLGAVGTMQNGGQQMRFALRTTGKQIQGEQTLFSWDIDTEFIVAGEHETYVKVNRLKTDPVSPIVQLAGLDQLQGKWLTLPASGTASTSISLTPDPRYLRMQAEVITVLKDRGIITIDGHRVHHYDVAADKQKLAAFLQESGHGKDGATAAEILAGIDHLSLTGELWIDAQSYIIRKAQWSIQSTDPMKPVDISVELTVGDPNDDAVISPPADAQPIPSSPLWGGASSIPAQ